MKWTQVSKLLFATTLIAAGCSDMADDASTVQSAVLGDRLPGIQATAGLLDEATDAFNTFEDINDGLGPIFNAQACGQCHTNGAIGGAGEQIERRFGRFDNGVFNPLGNEGGSLRQLFTVGQFTALNGQSCNVPLEREPADATVHNVGRLTTPTFGLGLVDSIPDSFFDGLVAAEPAAVRGVVNRGQIVLPNPGDPAQSIG